MWCFMFDIFTEHYEFKVYPCINTAFPLMAEELYYVDMSHFICLLLSDETFGVFSLFVNVYRYPCAGIWSDKFSVYLSTYLGVTGTQVWGADKALRECVRNA